MMFNSQSMEKTLPLALTVLSLFLVRKRIMAFLIFYFGIVCSSKIEPVQIYS